jgi:pimeloyl-ACP methyl ester carboxylesterase
LIKKLEKLGFVEKSAVANGVRLNYAEGPANGTPVLLIPGQSMPWESYQLVMPLLARNFHVFAVDVRGHGKSGHTPGAYAFSTVGRDFAAFLKDVVREPAIVSGNSSGGVIAVWLAANVPECVLAIVPEDPPLFSSEWPRMRDDLWACRLFEQVVDSLTGPGGRDIAGFFGRLRVPVLKGQKLMSFPRPLAWVLERAIRSRQGKAPGEPVDIPWLPLHVRLFVRGLSEYDPDFTRACVDGSICDIDHADMLGRVKCPMTLLQADWFRHPELGLVGAMDDDDVARVKTLVPHAEVQRWRSAHVMHIAAPKRFAAAIERISERV